MARNRINEDENLEESFDINQLKRLLSYVGPFKGKLVTAVIIMIISSGLSMLIPVFMKNVMDTITESNFGDSLTQDAAVKRIVLYSVATFVILLVCALITRVKIKLTNEAGQGIVYNLRRELFVHLQKLPFSYFDDKPHGKIQVRVVNYVNNLSDLLSNGIVNTITDTISMFFIVFFMLYLNVKFTIIVLCGLPVLVAIVLFVKNRQHKAWQIQSNKQSNLNAYIAESVNGIRVTQSFVREDYNADFFRDLNGEARTAWLNAVKYNFILRPVIDNINVISTAVIYVLGIGMLAKGNVVITVGLLTAFTGYVARFWQPIMTLASFYNSLLTAISYLERIFETIDAPVLVKDKEGAGEMPPIVGNVEFKDVHFAYEDGVEILHGVSFKAGGKLCYRRPYRSWKKHDC